MRPVVKKSVQQQLFVLIALAATGSAPALGQDAAAGETVFKICAACHDIGDAARNRMGPVLTGVVGRTAGTYDGFKYSSAMVEAGAGGLVWNADTLDRFLASPTDFIKGTKMVGIKVKDATDRADVIDYLSTFSDAAGKAGPAIRPGAPTPVSRGEEP
jgi:cytochrome c